MQNWHIVQHLSAGYRAIRNEAATDEDVSPYCLYQHDAEAWAEHEWGPQFTPDHVGSITPQELGSALAQLAAHVLTDMQKRHALNRLCELARARPLKFPQDVTDMVREAKALIKIEHRAPRGC